MKQLISLLLHILKFGRQKWFEGLGHVWEENPFCNVNDGEHSTGAALYGVEGGGLWCLTSSLLSEPAKHSVAVSFMQTVHSAG